MFAQAHPKVIVGNRKKVSIEKKVHRVNMTESSSDKFPTWVFNFGPYGKLRAVRENSSIMLKYATFEVCFFQVFYWQKSGCECKTINTLRNTLLYLFCWKNPFCVLHCFPPHSLYKCIHKRTGLTRIVCSPALHIQCCGDMPIVGLELCIEELVGSRLFFTSKQCKHFDRGWIIKFFSQKNPLD